jgi:hypothetical protein
MNNKTSPKIANDRKKEKRIRKREKKNQSKETIRTVRI